MVEPFLATPFPRAPQIPRRALDAWRTARASGSNILILGPNTLVQMLLERIRPELRQPAILSWCSPFTPSAPPPMGTLILRDLGSLPPFNQGLLLNWLRKSPLTQIISTTAMPLLSGVGRTFSDDLYQRLSTVQIDL